jgi:4-carboxymuconolactone decarboxylase
VRELSITHLFAHVWNRPTLSMRDRSLITITLLAAQGRTDQLRDHIRGARHRGMTRDEIMETMVQVAHYAGWPSGIGGQIVAEEIFAE